MKDVPVWTLGRDAWGARRAAAGTGWGRYLERTLGHVEGRPEADDPAFPDWQRYMLEDPLHLASAVAVAMRLPVGRLTKGPRLAHAFVMLPNHDGVPDRWPCLDWSGVRTLKQIRRDMRDTWGRLEFDTDVSSIRPNAGTLRDARSRPHVAAAMRLAWPRVSATTLLHGRLRYLDVVDVTSSRATGRPRRVDTIDVRGITK